MRVNNRLGFLTFSDLAQFVGKKFVRLLGEIIGLELSTWTMRLCGAVRFGHHRPFISVKKQTLSAWYSVLFPAPHFVTIG